MTQEVETYEIKARNNRWVDARLLLELKPKQKITPRQRRRYPVDDIHERELLDRTDDFRYLFEVGTVIRCLGPEWFVQHLLRCKQRESETEAHTARPPQPQPQHTTSMTNYWSNMIV